MNFKFFDTPFQGLKIIERKIIGDERGFIERMFCEDNLKDIIFNKSIVQINHSLTKRKSTVRGMHYQIYPYAEKKIISCLKGKIWDVAVDLRKNSSTFLKYYGVILSEENLKSFVIPEGFAHGFQTISENCELLYLHTERYVPDYEKGLNPMDPIIDIKWPMPISQLSDRDKNQEMLDENFLGI